ncbi:dihydrodipicolinate reductase-like protein CRR1, chloroplastic isoform X2 [Asparagus officinalis]|uniref:dihydrodipicolinate reductase-like protein CRR1, chloroplastic isoform X2 n=1 Tax=Asparagus officinalis TaxID=4686 RepID=UPI00098E0B67|nr:dihydrodipicolinate reductase-like protein CRR1, chloroplastic isoform X2 [Asparagus officinalis]
MASLSYHSLQLTNICNKRSQRKNANDNVTTFIISCTMQQPSQNNIKVVINGATKDIGRAAIVAVTKARGMELAGAIDTRLVGEDAGVAAAFGLRSVVHVPKLQLDTVSALSGFCEKASMGCLIAPTLSIGSVLLQQAAISASFHYNNVEIVESRADSKDLPSPEAIQIADNLSNLGQLYNREDISTDAPARGQILGEDGIRVHSLVLPGLPSNTTVNFSGPGEVYTLKHDITNVQSLMPGLILAIRKVVRLKNLIYGLEKFL